MPLPTRSAPTPGPPDLTVMAWAYDDSGAVLGAGDATSPTPEPATGMLNRTRRARFGGRRSAPLAQGAQSRLKRLLLVGWDAADAGR